MSDRVPPSSPKRTAGSDGEAGRRGDAAPIGAAPGEYAPVAASGIGGHELAVLDFDASAAARLGRLGQAIATRPAPGVRTALAVTGSCAQGRVQPFPADVDFFERVHLAAPTRAEALRRLGELVRETVARAAAEPGFALEEVYFGQLPAALAAAQPHRVGAALAWREADVVSGAVALRVPGGGPAGRVTWAEAATDPGLVKLDWFVGGGLVGRPARVSKVVDPTWERPDGRVESLDGAVDADFQQVYLAAAAAALAEELTGGTAGDRSGYLLAMEREVVRHRRRRPPDHAKVAKRLYNLCRLSGRFAEALFLRDLLAEAPARLAQLRAALEVAGLRRCDGREGSAVPPELAAILDELDAAVPGGAAWATTVAACREGGGEERRAAMAALDALLAERINAAFGARLLGHGPTAALLATLEARHPAG